MEQPPFASKRVAFFGGSFDPPHQGHLAVARAARAALGLDLVLFAPVGAQPLKPQGATASFEDRLAMTRLAVAGEPGFAVSLIDAPQPSGAPNFTIDTLFSLRGELPPGATLFLLMGADSFLALRRWRRSGDLLFAAAPIVASRPGQPLDDLLSALPQGLTMEATTGQEDDSAEACAGGVEVRRYLLRNAAGETAPFYLLPGLDVEVSATGIRDLIRDRPSAAFASPDGRYPLLPEAVLAYIRSNRLYG